MKAGVLVLTLFMLAGIPARPAHAAPNPVTDWAAIVQTSIHNAAAPRSGGAAQLLHTMVMLAVYDAVVAIEGGYEPYAAAIEGGSGADVRAAVATAAYRTARAKVAPSQHAYLDQQYTAYMTQVREGSSKVYGVAVGEAAAGALLRRRANDGFDAVVLYECSASPVPLGEFIPDAGCPVNGTPQPADVKIGRVQPFAIRSVSSYRPKGPLDMTSRIYAKDFEETRLYGRNDSVYRTVEQTDIAYFWSEHPYVHWNRNLIALAMQYDLDTLDTARLFAMVHTSVGDAVIAGFEAKYYFRAWRPRTAIPNGDIDGNDNTDTEPLWKPLLMVNHPEYPSGHGFWSRALTDAVEEFFKTDKVRWTITTSKTAVPQLIQTERTYERLSELMTEIGNARIWGGLHWRHAIEDGERIGDKVSDEVLKRAFRRTR